jgi:ABC-type bacteriocin/lantibiotic exporter with double-glycine peptidase domain
MILNGSVYENIAIGETRTPTRVKRVQDLLELVQLTHFISELPEGLETDLGELAGTISGGQRQRIALARAMYTDPDLIIFDESTNALDSNNEEIFYSNLRKMLPEKTIISVSHNRNVKHLGEPYILLVNGKISAN